MTCKTCKFWVDEKHRLAKNGNQSTDDARNENAGTCRRYAPSARTNNFRCWPVTVESDYCHDWQEKAPSTTTVSSATTQTIPAPMPDNAVPAAKTSFFKTRKKSAVDKSKD